MDTRLHGERRAPLAPNRSPPAPEWQPAFFDLVRRFSGSRGEAPRSTWIRNRPPGARPHPCSVFARFKPACRAATCLPKRPKEPGSLDPISARRLRIFIDVHFREPGSRLNRFRGFGRRSAPSPGKGRTRAPRNPRPPECRNLQCASPVGRHQFGGVPWNASRGTGHTCRLGRPIHRHGIDTVTVRANDATFLHRRDSLCKHFPFIWGAFAPATTSGISQMPSLYHHCSWRRPAFTAHHSKERKDTG